MSITDALTVDLGASFLYWRRNFRGGYLDKWRGGDIAVEKGAGQLPFKTAPPGVFRASVLRDEGWTVVGDFDDYDSLVSGIKAEAGVVAR